MQPFSAEHPPLWFRIIVYVVLAVVAVGLVMIVSRNALVTSYQQAVSLRQQLEELVDRKLEITRSIAHKLAAGEALLTDYNVAERTESMRELSSMFCSIDAQFNTLVTDKIRSDGLSAVPASAAGLEALDAQISDIADRYNTAALGFNKKIVSFANIVTVKMLSLQPMERFACTQAFLNAY
jgi:hypothetical protein